MRALALNFLIANIWMMLNEASLFTVVTGFLLGFGMLTIFPGVWGESRVRTAFAGRGEVYRSFWAGVFSVLLAAVQNQPVAEHE